MILTDFHIHSTYSDGKLTIPELVDYFGKRGIKVIAITDHLCEDKTFLGKASVFLNKTLTKNSFPLYLEEIKQEAKRAMKEYGMLVLASVEITKNAVKFHHSAHLLAIGIKSFIDPNLSILEILEEIKLQNGLSIAAHPVSTRFIEHQTYQLWDQREELKHYIDVWEVASGPFLFKEVMQSGLPIIANSDFHVPKQMRSWKTHINSSLDFDSIKKAIINQDIRFVFFENEKLQENENHWLEYA